MVNMVNMVLNKKVFKKYNFENTYMPLHMPYVENGLKKFQFGMFQSMTT